MNEYPYRSDMQQNNDKQTFDRSSYASRTEQAGHPQPPETRFEPVPKRNRSGIRLTAAALCFSLLGSALGAGGVLLAQHLTDTGDDTSIQNTDAGSNDGDVTNLLLGQRENSVIETVEVETGKLMTAAEVYAANVHSTVGITTSITTNYWGYQTTSAASGSGFIISSDGYILTNFHVIEDSDSICVTLYSGEEYDAALIGYDESNDIAVLKVDAEGLSPVILGDSDNLNVGDSVVAIGNPLGELTFSLTAGAVSAKDREVTLSSGVTMNLLQTDCAINSGNSGGALFNMYGEVIGVTNAKYSGSSASEASIDNIGFAIPINSIRSVVESIIEKGYISKPYMGVSVTDVSKEYQLYGLPQGAAVQSVVEGSPAEKAGLQAGDIITKADDTQITCANDLGELVSSCEIGQTLQLTVYRKGETIAVTVTVDEQIQSALQEDDSQQNTQNNYPWGSGGRQ